jgi:hypothetical protein
MSKFLVHVDTLTFDVMVNPIYSMNAVYHNLKYAALKRTNFSNRVQDVTNVDMLFKVMAEIDVWFAREWHIVERSTTNDIADWVARRTPSS